MERSLCPRPRAWGAVRMGPPAALALVLTTLSPAGAALKISPGQELIYSGTTTLKITSTEGPAQIIAGPLHCSALVSEADPAKGYSVILMRRFQPDTKAGQDQNQSDVGLSTVQFSP